MHTPTVSRARFIGLLASLALLALLGVTGLASAQPGYRLVSSTESRVVFEVEAESPTFQSSPALEGTERVSIAGFVATGPEGAAGVPSRVFWVAMPPSGTYRVRGTVIETVPLGNHRIEPVPGAVAERADDMVSTRDVYRIDPAVYENARAIAGAEDAGVARIRHQRVLGVRVQPITYDPRTGSTVLASRIRVEVDFSGTDDAGDAVSGRMPVAERPEWSRILDGMVVNPTQARQWRVKPVRPGSRSSARTSRALDGPLVKLIVDETRLYRVRAADAIARGLPGGTAVADLHLFKRGYDEATTTARTIDVPYHVVEDAAGSPGAFDGDDYLIFYAQSIRDDAEQGDPIAKFSDVNAYWLGTSTGPAMAPRLLSAGFVSADTATAAFAVSRRFERDLFFMEETPPGLRDFYYYNGWFVQSLSAPFALDAIKTDRTFRVAAEFLGATRGRPTRRIDVKIQNAKGTIDLGSVLVPDKQRVTWLSQPISAAQLVEGLNTLRLDPNGANVVRNLDALLNGFDVIYESPYRARGNVLVFDSAALAGDTSITVTGLARKDVLLFDITDPGQPSYCPLMDDHFTPVTGGFALSIRESFTNRRRYALAPLNGIEALTGAQIVAHTASNLIGGVAESGVDVLIVAHGDFVSETQRLVDWRRAQGYRVLLADANSVYDEFNGGVMHPRAIRRFARHFFEHGNASFLLLVGDASEDNKRVHADSGPNFVPTESFTEYVGAGFDEDEVVTTDKYYVMLDHDFIEQPTTDRTKYLPSLMIGRLPSGSVVELRQMIDKIIGFEQPKPDDFWRRRALRVADDAWSYGGDFQSCYRSIEVGFENAEQAAADITEESLPGGFDVVRFFLSNRIEHPTPGTCVFANVQTSRCRLGATPVLLGEINRGASVLSFQAHMDRSQICHEALFTSSTEADGIRDYTRVKNEGKPFVVFGFGCHISDFALHRELIRNTPNGPTGDCVAELLMMLANKGAVAAYGSTGFEYLSTNVSYTDILTRAFYVKPPTSPEIASGRSQARWILGELMTQAELENLAIRGASGPGEGAVGMIKRYHVLGDPAMRIDGGPPRYDVTVDGNPFQSGGVLFSGQSGAPISVRAEIRDEVAIEKIRLLIDGVDATADLAVSPLADSTLDASRAYEVTFEHEVLPKTYDIRLQALQAADTTGMNYYTVGEFIFRVELNATLRVNGRRVAGNGDPVPPVAAYAVELVSPVKLDPARIRVEIDENPVVPIDVVQPAPDDSTMWLVNFSAELDTGPHVIVVFVDNSPFEFQVVVSNATGLREVIAYPNPFRDETQFVFRNDVTIDDGRIDVFTTSGKRVARLDIPSSARGPGQNAVPWDGRTYSGDKVANGIYLFVITVKQGGQNSTQRGKLARIE